MFESSYLIDPGAHMTRMYDPKTRSVVSVRSCRLAKRPQVVGEKLSSSPGRATTDSFILLIKRKSKQIRLH